MTAIKSLGMTSGGIGSAELNDVVRPSVSRSREGVEVTTMYVGVVHTIDSVQRVVTSNCRQEFLRLLAQYACERAPDELWPEDARCIRSLVEGGRLDDAVAHYFASVGQRWDREWLVTSAVEVETTPNCASGR